MYTIELTTSEKGFVLNNDGPRSRGDNYYIIKHGDKLGIKNNLDNSTLLTPLHYSKWNNGEFASLQDAIDGIEEILFKNASTGVTTQTTIYENVKDYGAIGDGLTDDTKSIEDAITASLTKNRSIFFPVGEFLIKRGLVMQDDMQFLGVNGSILTKPQSVTQLIQANVALGDTTVEVEDGSLYEVGQAFYFGEDDRMNSYQGTTGVITSISGNTIGFEADRSTGAKGNYTTSSDLKFSSIFSMITTNSTKYSAEDISIENLTINPNITINDPQAYSLSPINIDPQTSSEPIIGIHRNCTIKNVTITESHTDGISVQNAGDLLIENCRVDNIKNKGIHFGTTCENVTIKGSYVYNCEEGGIYWCFNNNKILVDGCFFKGNNKACFGLGVEDNNTTITNNFFDDNYISVDMFGGARNLTISNNVFTNNYASNTNGSIIMINNSSFISICDNIFTDWQVGNAGYCISHKNCNNISIKGNQINNFIGNTVIKDLNTSGSSVKLNIVDNKISGSGIGISLFRTIDSIVSDNIIDVEDKPINIYSDSEYLSLSNNKINKSISNSGSYIKINGVYYDNLNGVTPNPNNYDDGAIVKDTSNNDVYILSKDGLDWNKTVGTLENGINDAYNDGVETITIVNAVETNGTITKNATDINLYSPAGGNLVVVTDIQVDLTNVDKIFIDWELNGSGQNYVYSYLGVATSKLDATIDSFINTRATQFNRVVNELDVSGLTGNYYLKVRYSNGNINAEGNLTIFRLGYR